jgi:hypothetical protein
MAEYPQPIIRFPVSLCVDVFKQKSRPGGRLILIRVNLPTCPLATRCVALRTRGGC